MSHCEDNLSKHIQIMHENAVNHDNLSNHDYLDIHDEISKECKNVLNIYCLIVPNCAWLKVADSAY